MSIKISIITLGCDKNTVDSEHMLGLLVSNRYLITDFPEEADVVIVNTCGFINDAKEESINTLLKIAVYKRKNPNLKLIAIGCMVQKYWRELAEEIPEIDGLLGSNNILTLPMVLEKIILGQKVCLVNSQLNISDVLIPRILSNQGPSSFLKIAEGCNNKCTYCAIPDLRGRYRSKGFSPLIKEAKFLVDKGIKEISLVAQDITQYGRDLFNKTNLVCLLEKLIEIQGLEWIRLLYCYPSFIDDNLIQFINEQSKICKYIDIPLQHADEEILCKMGRRQKTEEIYDLIYKLRTTIPDIAIRSTFIVGFPGESEEHFNNLLKFLEEIKLDWVGAFKYSQEEGTLAASFSNQVSEVIKEERYKQLMALQKNITTERNQRWLGRKLPVLIERKWEEGSYLWQGRTQQQAPEVDGTLFIHTEKVLQPGQFVNVTITGIEEYDLVGEI